MIAFEIISIAIHMIAAILAAELLMQVSQRTEKEGHVCFASLITLLIFIGSIAYVFLDSMWVINEHWDEIKTTYEDLGWVLYEWLQGVTIILTLHLIKIFINFKEGDCEC